MSVLKDFENRVSWLEFWELKFNKIFEDFLLSIQKNKIFLKNAKGQENQLAPVFFCALKL